MEKYKKKGQEPFHNQTMKTKQTKKFLEECNKEIKLEESGELDIREASYNICGLCNIFFDHIDPEYEEVMDIACDLELPDEHRQREEKDWEKLKSLLDKTNQN